MDHAAYYGELLCAISMGLEYTMQWVLFFLPCFLFERAIDWSVHTIRVPQYECPSVRRVACFLSSKDRLAFGITHIRLGLPRVAEGGRRNVVCVLE